MRYEMKSKLTVADALKIIGLESSATPSKEELKKAYYAMVKQVHPDAGGSEERMKVVNEAYEVLCDSRIDLRVERRDWMGESKEIADSITKTLESSLSTSVFTKYFEEIFGSPFTCDSEIGTRKGYNTHNAVFMAKFISADKETYLKLHGYVDVFSIMTSKSTNLTGGASEIPISVDVEIVHKNKKVKPYRRNYLFGESSKVVFSPEDLFPREKMDKAVASSKKRTFSKQDMLTSLRSKYDASFDGEYLRIPIGKDYRLVLYRIVFRRQASWGINGFYKTKPVQERVLFGVMSMPEDEQTLLSIEQAVKAISEAHESEILEIAKQEILKLTEASKSRKESV